jgi:hypothetical protein
MKIQCRGDEDLASPICHGAQSMRSRQMLSAVFVKPSTTATQTTAMDATVRRAIGQRPVEWWGLGDGAAS